MINLRLINKEESGIELLILETIRGIYYLLVLVNYKNIFYFWLSNASIKSNLLSFVI